MAGDKMAPFGWKVVCFAIALLATLPIASFSQTSVSATINGIVTDQSGAVVPGVKITVTNIGTRQVFTTTTNASGYYVVPNLPPGVYDLQRAQPVNGQ